MIDYTGAFEKPFIKKNLKSILIGLAFAIFQMIPFIGLFFSWTLTGFFLESTGLGKIKAGKKLPEWKTSIILPYFVKGAANTAITLIYLIPAILVFAFGAGSAVMAFLEAVPWDQMVNQTEEQMSATIQPIIQSMLPSIKSAIPFLIISAVLFIFAMYLVPMAVLTYFKDNKFKSAFDLKRVMRKAFTLRYLLILLITVVVSIILGSLIGIIPYVGKNIASFFAGVIGFSLLGQVYIELDKKKK